MDLPKEGSIVIQLKDGRESRINCSVHKDNNSEYYNSYILELTSEVDKEIIKKLEKFKLLSSESEKRAGARFNIGLENWKSFGLNTPEVLLYLNKKSYKCIIENVSCSGVLLTGESSPIQQSDVGISFVCGFKNPRINVIQKAMVVRCQMLKKAYAKYSLHFLDPVSLTWLERILKYAEAQE